MKKEMQRQLVHVAGFLFVVLALFIGRFVVVYFFLAAAILGMYSIYIKREIQRLNLLERMERKVRDFILKFEREDVPRPFTGAVWFFFTGGLVFLIFPLTIASAAVLMLAIGDGFSTLIGTHFGRHRITEHKTVEGSLTCFIGSLSSIFFLPISLALLGSLVATIVEIIPDLKPLRGLKNKGWLDDNFLIPILAGVVVFAASAL